MNPAKRKKLYRLALAEEKKDAVAEVKLAAEPKKQAELGLKEIPTANTQVTKQEIASMPVAVSVAQASLSVEQPAIVETTIAESVVVQTAAAETALSGGEQTISHPVMEIKKKKKN